MTPSRRSADHARQAWEAMQDFVDTNGRKHAMQEALGLRLGGGRGKILFKLRERPMTLTEIADGHGIDASYATLIVDKLEGLGLVERTAHPDDRRRKLVRLTPTGVEVAAKADAILAEPPPALLALSAADIAQLAKLLARLGDQTPDAPRPSPAAKRAAPSRPTKSTSLP
jgi:DNA-binding MarR family transcriptional regulator